MEKHPTLVCVGLLLEERGGKTDAQELHSVWPDPTLQRIGPAGRIVVWPHPLLSDPLEPVVTYGPRR